MAPALVASPVLVTRRLPESSRSIAYTGRWRLAFSRAYSGGAVRFATAAGASATVRFTGRRVVWTGPVGPTRGQARVYVDGAYVGRVDLHRSSFTGRRALFSRAWNGTGQHTLRIQVVGTSGHPTVAIDEFVVTG